jgi:hypothetical protein
MHITVTRDAGSVHHAMTDVAVVSLRSPAQRDFQCYTAHASRVRTCGRPQRPCIASRKQAAFVMSGRRVSRQGWGWDAVTTRGDLRTGAWASGHVVRAKSRVTGGYDVGKSWSSHFCWDCCMRARS